jgi:pimeloyl-ACP methyl ester carboxylesterase
LSQTFAIDRWIERDGIRLAVAEFGDRRGAPIVALHGFPECGHTWSPIGERLGEQGVRVVAPDLRAHGSSDAPAPIAAYRMERLLDDVAAVIGDVGGGPASVVGHDWGGALTWLLAERRPWLLERAVIINAPHPAVLRRALLHDPDQRRRSSYILQVQVPGVPERRLGRDRAAALTRLFPADQYDVDIVDHFRDAWTRPGALRGMLNWYRAFGRDRSFRQRPGRITVPTTLVWGLTDPVFGRSVLDDSAALVDDLELVTYDTVGHSPHRERPDDIAEIVHRTLG